MNKEMGSLIVSIITTLNTFSNLEKNNKLIENYFKKVLKVYVKEHRENEELDPVAFIKERFNFNHYFIPSYIFYLVDKSDKEKLHKVLMTDYRVNFPSKTNLIGRGVVNVLLLVLIIIINVIAFLGVASVLSAVFISFLSLFKFKAFANSSKDIIVSILCLILMAIVCIAYTFVVNKLTIDDYTLKTKQIKKKIKRKVKHFDRKSIVKRFLKIGSDNEVSDYYIK